MSEVEDVIKREVSHKLDEILGSVAGKATERVMKKESDMSSMSDGAVRVADGWTIGADAAELEPGGEMGEAPVGFEAKKLARYLVDVKSRKSVRDGRSSKAWVRTLTRGPSKMRGQEEPSEEIGAVSVVALHNLKAAIVDMLS